MSCISALARVFGRENIRLWGGYVTAPFAFVTLDGSFFWMLRSDASAMGRALDVIWYDLGVTKATGLVTYPLWEWGILETIVMCF